MATQQPPQIARSAPERSEAQEQFRATSLRRQHGETEEKEDAVRQLPRLLPSELVGPGEVHWALRKPRGRLPMRKCSG
jgi:hypothetical protein